MTTRIGETPQDPFLSSSAYMLCRLRYIVRLIAYPFPLLSRPTIMLIQQLQISGDDGES